MYIFNKILIFFENIFHRKEPSCFTHCGIDNAPSEPTPVIEPKTTVGFNYTIEGHTDNTEEENARIPAIQAAVNRYLLSEEFKNYLKDSKNGLDLDQTEGLSVDEVVEKIIKSNAHIVVRFYYSAFTRTIGYRNPGENIVFCNRKYHDGYSIKDEASNIAHEFLHIINVTAPLCGFQHDFYATARRPFSVNYLANSAIESFSD